MKYFREIVFCFTYDELSHTELLQEFIEAWKVSDKVINYLQEIEKKNAVFNIYFNIYSSAIKNIENGIRISADGSIEYDKFFEVSCGLFETFLYNKNIDFTIWSPSEKIRAAFTDMHIKLDTMEEELIQVENDDYAIKEKVSYELENVLKYSDYILNNIKQLDERVIDFIKKYKIKLGLHKKNNYAVQKKYEDKIDSVKFLLKNPDNKMRDKIAHFREGSGYFDLGLFENAIEEFKKVLEIEPNDIKSLINLGWSYYFSKNYNDAFEKFRAILNIDPINIQAHLGIANSYSETGYPEKAHETFKKILELSIDNDLKYYIYNKLGYISIKELDYESAINYFVKAIEIDYNKIEAHYNLANLYFNIGLFNESVYEYDVCLSIDAKDKKSFAYKILAECNIMINEKLFDETAEFISNSNNFEIEDSIFYNNLGAVYEKIGDNFNALKYFGKAIELDKNYFLAYMNLGYVYEKIDDFKNSVKYYETALKLNPNDISILTSLAWNYYILKDYDKSILLLEQVIEKDRNNIEALNKLGWIHTKLKDFDTALDIYQKVIELEPNCSLAYNNIGYIFYKKKNYNKAIIELNKTIRLNSDFDAITYAYYNLALVYIKKNIVDESIKNLKKCIKFNKTFVPAYFELAKLYKSENEYAKAIKYFDKCISLRPNSSYSSDAKNYISKINEILKGEMET